MPDSPRFVRHGRVDIAVHELRGGAGRSLVLLHGLGERSPDGVPPWAEAWTGPIVAVDFCGHGASTIPDGGGYSAEMLLGDVDAVLGDLGDVSIVGRGLGAYVALLAAGARAAQVHGTVLADGPGLAGGGVQPGSPTLVATSTTFAPPDPWALVELARDIRPPDYALTYLHFALERSTAPDPVIVSAMLRPEWLAAVVAEPGVPTASLASAVGLLEGTRTL